MFTCLRGSLLLRVMKWCMLTSCFRWQENLGKRQLVSLECASQVNNVALSLSLCVYISCSFLQDNLIWDNVASQLQEGMTLPIMMAGLQESQPLSWLLNGDNHQLMLPSEPKFLPFRWVNSCMKPAFLILQSFVIMLW